MSAATTSAFVPRPASGTRKAAFLALAFACFWAWILLAVNSPALFTFETPSYLSYSSMALCFYLILFTFRLICIVLARKLDSSLLNQRLLIIASGGVSAGTILLVFSRQSAFSEIIFVMVVFGIILIAIGFSWLSSAWARALRELVVQQVLFWATCGFLLAAAITLLVLVLPAPFLVTLLIALPSLSGLFIVFASRQFGNAIVDGSLAHPAPIATGQLRNKTIILVVGIMFIGLTGTTSLTIRGLAHVEGLYLYGLYNAIGILVFSAILLPTIGLIKPYLKKTAYTLVFSRVLILVLAISIALPGVFPTLSFSVANVLMSGGMCCIEILLIFYSVSYSRQRNTSILISFGVTQCSLEIMAALGPFVSSALNGSLGGGSLGGGSLSGDALNGPIFALTMVVALMLIAIFFLIPALEFFNRILFIEPISGRGHVLDRGFLVSRYELTHREVEVAELLSKGRSLPFIQKELTISLSTAQTHARHIYEKLGVHDRQELIDLIEAEVDKE
ncbi:MAG: helix-turn-helix transcriptional regulator [Coriobacteriales bacterium]|nr:helix-turn-helix transcriptional regulator [Coriobacteriales bacterium]